MKKIALWAALGLLAGLAGLGRTIELSIEENRVRTGTIGYIDIRRVYEEYPETQKAKEQFEAEIHKRDVVLQGERKDLRDLRKKLSELEAERNFLTATPIRVSSAAAPAPPPAASTGPARSPLPNAPPASVANLPGLPGLVVAASTAPVSVSTSPAAGRPPAVAASTAAAVASSSAPAVSAPKASAVSASTAPVSVSSVPTSSAPAPAVSVSSVPAVPDAVRADIEARTAKLDKQIAETKDKIAKAEKGLKGDSARLEGELSKIEGAESHTLLGQIYRKVQEVAREAGVSVVVDKNSILYGHHAVDLTDKLIESLRTQQQEGKP